MRRNTGAVFVGFTVFFILNLGLGSIQAGATENQDRSYIGPYRGEYLNRVAFPLGGIGAGMVCLEGTGALSHLSVRNHPDVFNEPLAFSALCVVGEGGLPNTARILEGPIPDWKYFGRPWTGNGGYGTSYGLPRFDEAEFLARFPFATIALRDQDLPFDVEITGWSPFVPRDADNSSLPVAALEYRFINSSGEKRDAVFSFNAGNFMAIPRKSMWPGATEAGEGILPFEDGFLLRQEGTEDMPHAEGGFAAFVEGDEAVVNHCWFRGGWFDPLTVLWKNIREARPVSRAPEPGRAPGASLFVPFSLEPGGEKTVRLMLVWYVPKSDIRLGTSPRDTVACEPGDGNCCPADSYAPWYAGRFPDIEGVARYWRRHYGELRDRSARFRDAFYGMTLPDEVVEAVAANLTILKSPTVLRQTNGSLWCFEGCRDIDGCCYGTCTHVWNYAQAIPHLFPGLERTLRETEFLVSQDASGHQTFRSALPIRPVTHDFHAAADGQLGGIMKAYRDWRVSGDTEWMRTLWPSVRSSLDYCIRSWDPRERGYLEEPHHNTYDIEYWGPNGHCTSFYLGALTAAAAMGEAAGEDVSLYRKLLRKGRRYLENELYDGEYFYQRIQWKGLRAKDPVEATRVGINMNYSPEAMELLQEEGPKYQYGKGCLSDGILGSWMARVCGLDEVADGGKVASHLRAVHRYNLKRDLSDHVNPQRPNFAMGRDGGLLLCTWPKGGELTLPFVYSNEVWTGIEYQVASHLMMQGLVEEGLEIVRVCRDRYDGRLRNPFDEYECGHWYARAMSSYGLLQGLTGVRYDAVERTLYIDSRMGGDFKTFLSAETGFGLAGLEGGRPFLEIREGSIDVDRVFVSGKEARLEVRDVVDGFHANTYIGDSGDTLRYRLFIPGTPKGASPLVVYLHGGMGRGNDNLRQISRGNTNGTHVWTEPSVQESHAPFVLAPQCPEGQRWSDLDSGELAASGRLLVGLIEELKGACAVDASRVYITGQSLGGAGTWDLIAKRPDLFAAAVPLCGRGNPSTAGVFADMPIWVFHGADDPVVSPAYSLEMVNALREVGSGVKYTEYPGVEHSVWLQAYREPELMEWLFAQKRGD